MDTLDMRLRRFAGSLMPRARDEQRACLWSVALVCRAAAADATAHARGARQPRLADQTRSRQAIMLGGLISPRCAHLLSVITLVVLAAEKGSDATVQDHLTEHTLVPCGQAMRAKRASGLASNAAAHGRVISREIARHVRSPHIAKIARQSQSWGGGARQGWKSACSTIVSAPLAR